MKPNKLRLIPILAIFFSLSLSAQINSGPGYMHGSYKKGDTITEYQEDPRKHNHPEVTIVKKVPHSEVVARQHRATQNQAPKPDTTATAEVSAAPDSTPAAPDTTMASTMAPAASPPDGTASNCGCVDKKMVYSAIGLIGLAAIMGIYLFILLMSDNNKRNPFIAVLHGMFNTAGLTLLIVYCIFQTGPIAGLIVLTLAALAGLGVIYYEVTGRPVPKWLGALHGALTLAGLVLLLIFAFAH